jgi:hypothetical protein
MNLFIMCFSIGLGYALGGAERQKAGKWREAEGSAGGIVTDKAGK